MYYSYNNNNNNINEIKAINISLNFKNVRICANVLKVLVRLGFLRGFKIDNNNIEILLKYHKNKPTILNLTIKDNIYLSYISLCKFKENHTILILSTTKGILTHKEAISKHIGGILICKIV